MNEYDESTFLGLTQTGHFGCKTNPALWNQFKKFTIDSKGKSQCFLGILDDS